MEIGTRKYGEIISSKSLTEDFILPHISIVWNPDGNSFSFSFLDIVEGRIQAPIYNATVAYDSNEMLPSNRGEVNDTQRKLEKWQPRISKLTIIQGGVIDS